MCPLLQAIADFGLVLVKQLLNKLLARIPWDFFWRVHQTQRRRRNDRLLHGYVRVPKRKLEVAVGALPVAEGAAGEAQHPAGVAGREGNLETIRGRIWQAVYAICPKVVI